MHRLGPLAILISALLTLLPLGCRTGHSADQVESEATPKEQATADEEKAASVAPMQDGRNVAQRLQAASLEAQIKQALVRQKQLRIFDFGADVTETHLTLRGDVNTRDQRTLAERIARRIEGIETVDNAVTVGGVPVEQLRGSEETETASAESKVYHTVEAGETLWDIARQYNASVSQIKRFNGIEAGAIHPGERLRIR